MKTIAVIGTGYVGLTTGVCFAHLGHRVVCADIDEAKVARLRAGESPILEEGLDELLAAEIASGRLTFVLGAATAATDCDFAFLCVPTPQSPDGSADLSYIAAAAAEIAPVLRPGAVVVNKSTVPLGTADMVAGIIDRDDVSVVSNPEFLREGAAIGDFLAPDRVVVGSSDRAAAQGVAALYARLEAQTVVTDARSAEMIKYASNAFLAVKLSFINSIAGLCEQTGADVLEVARGMGSDTRIGNRFLVAGPGWGGSCFPKDTSALHFISEDHDFDFPLLDAALRSNEQQLDLVADKVKAATGGWLHGKVVAAWGLTFKAGTDDLRCSPALEVINRLRAEGAHVVAYDPAIEGPIMGIDIASDAYSACVGVDALVVLTEWPEFAELDLHKVREVIGDPIIVDGRNLLDADAAVELGFTYEGIGRPNIGRTSAAKIASVA